MKEKGQVLIEFLVIITLLLGLFLFAIGVFQEKNNGFLFFKEGTQAQQTANQLARTINAVFLAGNGTKTIVLLEKNVDYTMLFSGNSVQVHWRNQFVGASLNTNRINAGALGAETKLLVSNNNGEIVVEPV